MKIIDYKHSQIILKEMLARVGAEIEGFDFEKDNWYHDYSWTAEQEEDFRVWLGKYLYKNKLVRKCKYRGQDHGYYRAGKLLLNYGFKLKDA